MQKFFFVLMLPVLIFAESMFMKGGKMMYKSVSETVKLSAEIVHSSLNTSSIVKEHIEKSTPISRTSSKEREAFLKEQFISKKELSGVKEVEKEAISVDAEAIKFFNSLNSDNLKPINIE